MTTQSAFQSTIGVLLAGGAGTRFAGPGHKLLTLVRGRRLFEWGLDAIRSAGLQPWVVWGRLADQAPLVGDDVVVLRNPDWRAGMATTIQVAITHARTLGVDAL
ncbi:MAG TPA: NTP transferase domain-containing protein, partial [Ilumatobacteraceae bacterium]